MNIAIFVLQQVLLFSVPLLIVGLGGMFCERGGIINIALEGTMLTGAFCGVFYLYNMQGVASGQHIFIISMLIAGFAGIVFSVLHAIASINFNANQAISGIALNQAAPAAAIFVARLLIGVQQIGFSNDFRIEKVPILGDIPIIGDIFFQKVYITLYIGIAILIIASIVLWKTKFGMRLRACGEYPQAADSVGISVKRVRYIGVLISGFLGGLGGLALIVPTSTEFNATVAGYGFLAVSVVIFGQWKPSRIFFAAVFFGVMKTLAAIYSVVPFLNDLSIDSFVYKMIPYIVTLAVLAFSSKKSQGPAAVGVPFDKGER
jgi:simple sugar transport system permease protein